MYSSSCVYLSRLTNTGILFAAFSGLSICAIAAPKFAQLPLQVALFLLGEVVFMERALQQLFILLYAMQLGYYRTVLCLIERELDIGRFEVKAPTVPETV